jgi:hypothetical protein
MANSKDVVVTGMSWSPMEAQYDATKAKEKSWES